MASSRVPCILHICVAKTHASRRAHRWCLSAFPENDPRLREQRNCGRKEMMDGSRVATDLFFPNFAVGDQISKIFCLSALWTSLNLLAKNQYPENTAQLFLTSSTMTPEPFRVFPSLAVDFSPHEHPHICLRNCILLLVTFATVTRWIRSIIFEVLLSRCWELLCGGTGSSAFEVFCHRDLSVMGMPEWAKGWNHVCPFSTNFFCNMILRHFFDRQENCIPCRVRTMDIISTSSHFHQTRQVKDGLVSACHPKVRVDQKRNLSSSK